jgi:PAS domain S-box-containing protein
MHLLFVFLLAASSPDLVMGATGSPKRVLILDSYGRNVAPTSTVISVFRTEVSSRSAEPIDVHEASLEMARFAQLEQELPFVSFLRERFSTHKPDLVVTVGSPALTFVERHRALFPGIPVVMAGVAEQALQSGAIPENTVVVPVSVDVKGSIEDILKVLPGPTNIQVVFGTSPIEAFWLKEFQQVSESFSSRVRFAYLNDLSFEDIRGRLAHLPPQSAVLYGMLLVDGRGTPCDPSEALKTLAEHANAPIFAVSESYLGFGIVGGRLIQERAAGAAAAEVALRILAGEPAGAIKIPLQPAPVPVYDWRALQRWGIDESRLPSGSVIRFRAPSLWERYRWYALGGVALLIFQCCLIVGLLVQRRRRGLAEDGLRQSERRLRLITNALPALIAHIDSEQRYRFTNAAYIDWFGIDPREALGRTVREVVGEFIYRSILPYVGRVLAGEHVYHSHDTVLPGGRPISIEAIYVPDLDEAGGVRGFYALAMDVTERNAARQESRRLQDELLHASRITTTGELAGTLAHEINQPLAAIMSNAQAARRFLDSPTPDLDEVREILQDIVAEDARAGEVINRLRAFLKKARTELEPVDLNAVFGEVAGFVRSDAVVRDAALSLELDPALPKVIGDRIQLQQVALNLVLNAFDAVDAQPRGERRVLLRTGRQDGIVHAAVCDSGKGLPTGESENLFKPFYTTKPKGLGMGLSISRSIIGRHQGRIWAERLPDGGACFRFCLPAAPEADTVGGP